MFYQVYLPAIQGHVPREVVRTFQAFLDFCYIVRRDVITDHDLLALKNALSCFHKNRDIFISTGVRSNFHLPRQHSMVHYHSLIRQFGAPNGLCSSITESKHIRAIKEPWRRSNRNEALGQMLVTNQRLDQLAAARADFTDQGMLNGSCLSEVLKALCKLTSLRFSNVSEYKEISCQLLLQMRRPMPLPMSKPAQMQTRLPKKSQHLTKTSMKRLSMIPMSLPRLN